MDWFAEIFVQTMGLTFFGYFILQVWLVRRWSGGWRLAALVPLLITGPAVLFSLYALSRGSNLWPLTLIFLAPVGCVYLLMAWGARTVVDG